MHFTIPYTYTILMYEWQTKMREVIFASLLSIQSFWDSRLRHAIILSKEVIPWNPMR